MGRQEGGEARKGWGTRTHRATVHQPIRLLLAIQRVPVSFVPFLASPKKQKTQMNEQKKAMFRPGVLHISWSKIASIPDALNHFPHLLRQLPRAIMITDSKHCQHRTSALGTTVTVFPTAGSRDDDHVGQNLTSPASDWVPCFDQQHDQHGDWQMPVHTRDVAQQWWPQSVLFSLYLFVLLCPSSELETTQLIFSPAEDLKVILFCLTISSWPLQEEIMWASSSRREEALIITPRAPSSPTSRTSLAHIY